MRVRGVKGIWSIFLSALLITSTGVMFGSSAEGSDEVEAASGSNRFVVWHDTTPGNADILIRRSTDGGATWQAAKNLSSNGHSGQPDLAAAGTNVYLAWVDLTSNSETFLRRSADNGATWKTVENLSNNAGGSSTPQVAS